MVTKTLLSALLLAVAITPAKTSLDPLNELKTRHDYKLAMKRPYFYMDNETLPFYDYYGAVLVSEYYLRLCPSIPNAKGSIWAKRKDENQEWAVHAVFSVNGKGSVGGNGMAFWYTKEPGVSTSLQVDRNVRINDHLGVRLGPAYGSSDTWDGLAIVFDTFDERENKRNMPYIYGMMNDNTKLFTQMPDPLNNQIGGCFSNYRNVPHPLHVKIVYAKNTLKVYLDHDKNGHEYHLCFSVSDLKLPTDYYFGFSASTGYMADDHDLISVDVYKIYDDAEAPKDLPPEPKIDEKDRQEFEKIHHKVEELREKELEDVMFHHDQKYGQGEHLNYKEIHEIQMKILDNVHELAMHVDNLQKASAKSESAPGRSADGHERGIELRRIETKIDAVSAELKGVKSDLEGIKNAIRDLSATVTRVQEKTHVLLEEKKSEKPMPDVLNEFSLFTTSNAIIALIVVAVAAVVLYALRALASDSSQKSKKFI